MARVYAKSLHTVRLTLERTLTSAAVLACALSLIAAGRFLPIS